MPTLDPPTKWERAGRAAGYLFVFLIGVGAVWFPAGQLDGGETKQTIDRLGPLLWVWALFIATALPAAVATLLGRHRVEFILVPLFTVALLVANVNVWFTVIETDSTMMARACASSALVCLLAVRWSSLNRLNKVATLWTRTEL